MNNRVSRGFKSGAFQLGSCRDRAARDQFCVSGVSRNGIKSSFHAQGGSSKEIGTQKDLDTRFAISSNGLLSLNEITNSSFRAARASAELIVEAPSLDVSTRSPLACVVAQQAPTTRTINANIA